jgi:hypothetical protein
MRKRLRLIPAGPGCRRKLCFCKVWATLRVARRASGTLAQTLQKQSFRLQRFALTATALTAMILNSSAQDIPKGHQIDHYRGLLARNPFTLPAPVVAQVQASVFDKLILVSWLKDRGKDVVFVQNTETNKVDKVTADSNESEFRLLEVRPNPNPQLVEAVITAGPDQGTVKFRTEAAGATAGGPMDSRPIPGGPVPLPGEGVPSQPVPGVPVPEQNPAANNPAFQAFQQAAQRGAMQAQPQRQGPQQTPGRGPKPSEIRRKRVLPPPNSNAQPSPIPGGRVAPGQQPD